MVNYLPDGELTPFAQAMPEQYQNNDVVTAYRTYYLKDKKTFAKWEKLNNVPDWWKPD